MLVQYVALPMHATGTSSLAATHVLLALALPQVMHLLRDTGTMLLAVGGATLSTMALHSWRTSRSCSPAASSSRASTTRCALQLLGSCVCSLGCCRLLSKLA
jgi:hypothetical protein